MLVDPYFITRSLLSFRLSSRNLFSSLQIHEEITMTRQSKCTNVNIFHCNSGSVVSNSFIISNNCFISNVRLLVVERYIGLITLYEKWKHFILYKVMAVSTFTIFFFSFYEEKRNCKNNWTWFNSRCGRYG